MAFHKIDEGAVVADQPASSGLAQDIDAQGRAAAAACLPGASAIWDIRNHPRLCALERHALPFLVRLPARTASLKVRVRGKADGTLGITLGALAVPVDWLDRPLPADGATVAVSSATEATQTLTLSGDDLIGVQGGWAIVCLTVTSVVGTAAAITSDPGGVTDGHLIAWGPVAAFFANKSTQFNDSIPCAAIEIRTSVPPAAPANASHVPQRAQAIRAQDDVSSGTVWFYPPIPDQYVAEFSPGNVDIAYWTPLGYFDLYSVEISVASIDARPGPGTALNAKAPPTARSARRIFAHSGEVFADHGRWHHLGPRPDAGKTDVTDPAKGWWGATTTPPVNPVADHIQITGSGWIDLGVCVVNRDDEYQDVDEATSKRRTAIEARALGCVQTYGEIVSNQRRYSRYHGRSGGEEFEVETRLSLDTLATLADAVTGDAESQTARAGQFVRRDPASDVTGYILGLSDLFDGGAAYSGTPVLHSLRGIFDAGRWGEYPWVVIRSQVRDDNLAASGRYARLQFAQVDRDAQGEGPSAFRPNRFLHLATWTVVALPGDDGDAIGEA